MRKYLIIILGSFILSPILVWIVMLLISKYSLFYIEGLHTLGAIGDAVGGLTNPVIGLLGAILTFFAFYIQYEFNKKQNEIILTQTKLMMHQNFHELFMVHYNKLESLRQNMPKHGEEISKYLKSFSYEDCNSVGQVFNEKLNIAKYEYDEEIISQFEYSLHSLIDYCFNSEFMYNNTRNDDFIIANFSKLFSLLSYEEIGLCYTIIHEDFREYMTKRISKKLGQFLITNYFENMKLFLSIKKTYM